MKKFISRLLFLLFAGATVFAATVVPKRSTDDIIAKRIIFTSNGLSTGTVVMDTNSGGNVLIAGKIMNASGVTLLGTGGESDPIWNSQSGNYFKLGATSNTTAISSITSSGASTFSLNLLNGANSNYASSISASSSGNTVYGSIVALNHTAASPTSAGYAMYIQDVSNEMTTTVPQSSSYGLLLSRFSYGKRQSGSINPLFAISDSTQGPGDLMVVYRGSPAKFRIDSTGDTYVYGNLYDGNTFQSMTSGGNLFPRLGRLSGGVNPNFMTGPVGFMVHLSSTQASSYAVYGGTSEGISGQYAAGVRGDSIGIGTGVYGHGVEGRLWSMFNKGVAKGAAVFGNEYLNSTNNVAIDTNVGYFLRDNFFTTGSGSIGAVMKIEDDTPESRGNLIEIIKQTSTKFKVDSTGDVYITNGVTIGNTTNTCTGTVIGTIKFSGDNFFGCNIASGRVQLN